MAFLSISSDVTASASFLVVLSIAKSLSFAFDEEILHRASLHSEWQQETRDREDFSIVC